jgi:hypothetical protein
VRMKDEEAAFEAVTREVIRSATIMCSQTLNYTMVYASTTLDTTAE